MSRFMSLIAVVLVLMMTSFIFGCMEEEGAGEGNGNGGNDGSGGDGGGDGGGDEGGLSYPPMDVEVTNLEPKWTSYPEDPLAEADLSVACDAINYGGSGYVDVVVFVNGTNSSMDLRRRIYLAQNEQAQVDFYAKFPCNPTEVTGRSENERLEILPSAVDDVDAKIANLYWDLHAWTDEAFPQLEASVFLSVINYGLPGHITVVVEVGCGNQTKKVEERIHIETNEQYELELPVTLPALPQNMSAYTRRPQADE